MPYAWDMPSISLKIPHSLPPAEAVKRIKNLVKDTKKKFGDKISDVEEKWEGTEGTFTFKAMGFTVAGTLAVHDDSVELHGTLPWAAFALRSKIENTIREEAEKLLK